MISKFIIFKIDILVLNRYEYVYFLFLFNLDEGGNYEMSIWLNQEIEILSPLCH
jgi:hypothetical protein